MDQRIRLIDACANRAREALRVLEDASRFVLDDGGLTAGLKVLRHEVTAAIDRLPVDRQSLIAARDIERDVGSLFSTPSETTRRDYASVIAAAGGRLTESLRSLEEITKTFGATGREFEQARYSAYGIAARLEQRMSRHLMQNTLCVLITEALCTNYPWLEVALAAAEGGAGLIQLREKELGSRELVERTKSLVRELDGAAMVIVNDRLDIALASGAQGVHLGQSDIALADARRIVGDRLFIGVSCANVDDAVSAATGGADLIGIGPMFESTTKPTNRSGGPELLRACLEHEDVAAIPHLAIGGIDAAGAETLGAAGCRGVAVCAAVCAADDPKRAAADICNALARGGATLAPCQSHSSSEHSTTDSP
ncbi:MAG: thiamine phosphate synthase [Planctomycetota bacterium]